MSVFVPGVGEVPVSVFVPGVGGVPVSIFVPGVGGVPVSVFVSSASGAEVSGLWALETSVSVVDSAPLRHVVDIKADSLDAGFGSKGFVVSENKHAYKLNSDNSNHLVCCSCFGCCCF